MKIIRKLLLAIFIVVSVVVILLPFAWMISISLRPDDQVLKVPLSLFGGKFTGDSYIGFLEKYDFFRIFGNSLLISLIPAIASTFTSAMAGYAFAKFKFKGKNVLFISIMATMMIPIFVLIVPLYLLMRDLGWYDTYYALIIPFLVSPFGIFLMRQFAYGVPDDLINAGRIDGASEYGIFFRIVFPTLMPAIGALMLLTFIQRWDDLLWPAIITTSENLKVLTVKLSQISRENNASTNWNRTMAGTVMATAPIIILFLSMQRFFIESLTMAGIKG